MLDEQAGAATAVAAEHDCCLAAAEHRVAATVLGDWHGARGDGGLGGTGVAVRQTKIEQRSLGAERGGAMEEVSTYLGKRRGSEGGEE